LGPVVNVEYGVLPQVGVTASAGYFGYSDVFSTYSLTLTSIPIIIGANWHFDPDFFPESKHLDTWVGGGLGYTFVSSFTSDPNIPFTTPFVNYFALDLRLGARYYFSEKFGLKLEIGYWTLGYVRLGIDVKF
jgi:outer membrane immunogenic protein